LSGVVTRIKKTCVIRAFSGEFASKAVGEFTHMEYTELLIVVTSGGEHGKTLECYFVCS
jgi:hypothetical protein